MPMRILLLIHSLDAGGAERVLSGLANHWVESGHRVRLLTLSAEARPFYPLSSAVEHRPLGLAGRSGGPLRAVAANLRRVRALRAQIEEFAPRVVVSFMVTSNLLALLGARGASVPVIISERIDPSRFEVGFPRRLLRRLLYPRAACLVVQTESIRSAFPPRLRKRSRVIPNAVLGVEGTRTGPREPVGERRLIAMGRLTGQKGFDLLLEAFGRLAERHPGWSLYIWGEGDERPRLEARRAELGLSDRVRLPGTTRFPTDEMRGADLFVLSSRYEGFPNVLCEAMSCGLPVVAFDCPGGPREIVRHEVDGLLVAAEDVGALAAALDRLMADGELRRRLGARAAEVAERFGPDRIYALWDTLLDEVTSESELPSS